MTYSLGQAKWVPGQISFQTTRTGRLPNVQPLIEAGLPYAPYIEHGSYARGIPDIARYGRDPYRGLGDVQMTDAQKKRSRFEVWVEGSRCANWKGRGLAQARKEAMRLAGERRANATIYLAGCVPVPVDTVLFAVPQRKPMNKDDVFRIHCTNWAMVGNDRGGFSGGRDVRGWRQAQRAAKRLARQQGQPCRIYSTGGRYALAQAMPDGRIRAFPRPVPWQKAFSSLGDTLTDWACDSQEFAKSWADRVNSGLSVGAQAAVLGAGIAGLIGGVLKRPLLGTALGAAVGYGTHAIWTAPQRVQPS